MHVIHRIFWVHYLPPLCALLGSRTRQLHLHYAWKKEDISQCDYIIIFLINIHCFDKVFVCCIMMTSSSTELWITYPQEKASTDTPDRRGGWASCEIHQPMKYYWVRRLWKIAVYQAGDEGSKQSLLLNVSIVIQLFIQKPCTLAGYQCKPCGVL